MCYANVDSNTVHETVTMACWYILDRQGSLLINGKSIMKVKTMM